MSYERHEQWCRLKFKPKHTDAARRLRDTYNLHRAADPHGSVRKWFAIRLADGTGDGILYDSKSDCVMHQHHNERYLAFIRINPHTMNACESEVVLRTHRRLYDNGLRMTDPDHRHGGMDVITRVAAEDVEAFSRGIVQNLQL